MKLRFFLALGLWLAFSVACSDNSGIAPPVTKNQVDTFTLWATRDSNLAEPSGFSVSGQGFGPQVVLTQDNPSFDFVYNVDDAGKSVFLTTQVLGVVSSVSIHPGFQRSQRTFDSVVTAPLNNYITEDTIHIAVGDVWYMRSALFCAALSSPLYGKLEVLSIDSVGRSVTFQALVDANCGYHGLSPGLPSN